MRGRFAAMSIDRSMQPSIRRPIVQSSTRDRPMQRPNRQRTPRRSVRPLHHPSDTRFSRIALRALRRRSSRRYPLLLMPFSVVAALRFPLVSEWCGAAARAKR